MKISQSKGKKTIITAIIAASLVIISTGSLLAYHYQVSPFNTNDTSVDLSKPTEEEKSAVADIKQQTVSQDKTQTGSDPATPPQPVEGTDKSSVHAEITAANQDESILHIRTLVQVVTSAGECKITLTKSPTQTYTTTSAIQPLSSSSTCKGFDIPLSELSAGVWTANLEFNNDNLTALATKEITVR
jgi:hypothetical protein